MNAQSFLRGACAIFVLSLLGVGVMPSSNAQETNTDELALAVSNAQKANMAAITDYSWKIKSTISSGGEKKADVLNELRFNTAGELETTNIGGESYVEKKRGLRGRAQKSQMEDFSKYLEGVLGHSFQYIFLSKGTMVDIFDRAEIKESETSIDVTAGGLFVEGDEFFLSVDPATKLATKLTFTTTYGEDTVKGVVVLDMVEGGPSKPARLEFDIQPKAVTIVSETYDWTEQK